MSAGFVLAPFAGAVAVPFAAGGLGFAFGAAGSVPFFAAGGLAFAFGAAGVPVPFGAFPLAGGVEVELAAEGGGGALPFGGAGAVEFTARAGGGGGAAVPF